MVPSTQATLIGKIDLPVTFGMTTNFRTETHTFQVANFSGVYHAILNRPCYAKFMVVANYTYLKLKMLGPKGIITVDASFQKAFMCETECIDFAAATVASTGELVIIQEQVIEDPPEISHKAT